MDKIKAVLNSENTKGVIAIVAAVIMYYTPDHIDRIIKACLMALGIQKFTIGSLFAPTKDKAGFDIIAYKLLFLGDICDIMMQTI